MTESQADMDALPSAEVRKQKWPSPIWLIPVSAILIGAWLLFQYWMDKNNVITISFPKAEGITANSTLIKYKDVAVGKVKKVGLDSDLNPLITMQLSDEINAVLSCNTRFWVVAPRIRGAEIQGLGTLFSGVYLGIDPGEPDAELDPFQTCYQVLDAPPVSRPERPGRTIKLHTERMGSLDIGSPVFYRQLKVGEVIDYHYQEDLGKIELTAFVERKFQRFVTDKSRFWNVSGAEFNVSASGAQFKMESLTSLVVGGIAFDTPERGEHTPPFSDTLKPFNLFDSYEKSKEKQYDDKLYFTLYFNSSLRGLAPGAPVEFKGIRVGEVEKVRMVMDQQALDVRIPVLITIEPQRFSEEISLQRAPDFLDLMVSKGMRAQLQNANILTGQMYIALDFEADAPQASIKRNQFHAEFPTSTTQVEELSNIAVGMAKDLEVTLSSIRNLVESDRITAGLSKFYDVLAEAETTLQQTRGLMVALRTETLPVVERSIASLGQNGDTLSKQAVSTLSGVQKNFDQVSTTVSTLSQSVQGTTSTMRKTLQQLQGTLSQVDRLLDRNSPTQHRLNETMEELTQMSRAVRDLTDTLSRSPNAVLRGRQGDKR